MSEAILIDEIEKVSKTTPTNEESKEGQEVRETSVDSQSAEASANQQSPGRVCTLCMYMLCVLCMYIVVVRPWKSGMRCMVECHFSMV